MLFSFSQVQYLIQSWADVAYAALCDLKQQSFGTDARGKVMLPVLNHTQGKCHAYVIIASLSHQPTVCDISEDKEDECNPEDKASDEMRATMDDSSETHPIHESYARQMTPKYIQGERMI